MGLRYEAWALPTVTPYERLIAHVPAIVDTGSGSVVLNDGGQGALSVPNDWDRLTDLMSSTHGSLIRVFDGTNLIHEWITQSAQYEMKRGGRVNISGPDMGYLMSKSLVYMFDYTDKPSNDVDWHWGSQANLLSNGSFNDGLNFIEGQGVSDGFELGLDPWWAGAIDGVSATLEIESSIVDTGSFSAKCTAILTEGGMTAPIRGLWPGKTYTCSIRVLAIVANDMILGCKGPENMGLGTATRIQEQSIGHLGGFEVQLLFTGTGSWETASYVFDVAPGQTATEMSVRDATTGFPGIFYVDTNTFSGYGVGMAPWQPTSEPQVTEFTSSDQVNPQEGPYTGKVTATDGHGIFQSVTNTEKGVTYTGEAWVRNTAGSARWALELTDELGTRIAQTSVVSTTTFQQMVVTGELPDNLPGPREMNLTLRNYSGATATAWFDDCKLYRGQPAATAGSIVLELHTDASVDHASDPRGASLDWLDLSSFTATTDSGSTSWAQTESFIARGGDTFLNTLRNLISLDYEWRIVAKSTPAGGLTHDLELYEPDGLGTDYTAATTPSVLIGLGVHGASIIRRIPEFSHVLVSAEEGAWSEAKNTTLDTNFGQWEAGIRYPASEIDTPLAVYAAQLVANEEKNLLSVEALAFATPNHPRPLVAYTVGDMLKWQFPPELPKEDRRVTRINYVNSEPTTYVITGTKILP